MPRHIVVNKKVGFRRRRSISSSRPRSALRPQSAKQIHHLEPEGTVGGTIGKYIRTEEVYVYIDSVKKTFKKQPGIYQQFVSIIGAIQNPSQVNILDLVDEVAQLFEGYSDLIAGFNAFLPNNYEIEVQQDAVVVKVYEKTGDGSFWEAKGRYKQEHGGAVGYIQELKHTVSYDPEKYQTFMDILSQFHAKKIDEIAAVRKVVRVLVDHPHLVLGFNEFLPEDYCIHMYNENTYTIKHPGPKGRPVTVTINLI